MTQRPFKILSIDGGGIKGLYSSKILAGIEKENGPIVEHFDLICGTSTGGIIALALASGITAQEISNFYETKGPRIFPCKNFLTRWLAMGRQIFIKAKYKESVLRRCLEEVFEQKKVGDTKTIVLIPTVNLTTGDAVVIKSDHQKHLTRDNDHLLVDVALATAAAPTYFPISRMNTLKGSQLVDGGLWANNPALLGLIEALKYYVGEEKEYERFRLLSVSSINNNTGWPVKRCRSLSAARWALRLIPTTMDTQSQSVNNYIYHLIDCLPGDYVRIESPRLSPEQAKVIELDRADPKAIKTIIALAEKESHRWNTSLEIKEFFKEAK